MLPFQMDGEPSFDTGDYIFVPNIRHALNGDMKSIRAYVIKDKPEPISLYIAPLTDEEKSIIRQGCLINYNRAKK